MRDCDYLDYFVSASRARPILTSVRPSGRAGLSWKVGFWGDLRLFLCRPPRQFLVLLDGRIERKLTVVLVKTLFFCNFRGTGFVFDFLYQTISISFSVGGLS